MSRLSRGWRLTRASLGLVSQDAALATLAILGVVVATSLAVIPLAAAGLALGNDDEAIGYALLGISVWVFYAVTVFFGVAIARAAALVLEGQDATVGRALRAAFRRLGPVLGWSLVSTAVTVVLAVLRGRGGAAGGILAAAGGAAWSLVTLLTIPVIAFEGLGPLASLKRSAALFRERWGEQITGSAGIGLACFVLMLPAIGVLAAGIALADQTVGVVLIVLGAAAVGAVAIAGRTASAAFAVVLYRYATLREVPLRFREPDLHGVARGGRAS